MEETFVVAGVFTYDHEAHIFAGRLESEGVKAFIDDNNIVAANPFLSNAVGGIKVRIYKKDLEKARAVFEKQLTEDERHLKKPPLVIHKSNFKPVLGVCPECESKEIYVQDLSWLSWAGFILTLGIFGPVVPPPFRTKNLCSECKHIWKS